MRDFFFAYTAKENLNICKNRNKKKDPRRDPLN